MQNEFSDEEGRNKKLSSQSNYTYNLQAAIYKCQFSTGSLLPYFLVVTSG